tara:strand:- start:4124 stop:5926 length:1803 start_codon:yes stop_codon:yes gene_type:complete
MKAKSKILERSMFRDPSEDENVGIMQGFMDIMDSDDMDDMDEMVGMDRESDDMDETSKDHHKKMNRRPNSPEILMNNLRGDMQSINARREELADIVGYRAASDTPAEVLALLQPVFKQQGIDALAQAQQVSMAPPPAAVLPPDAGGLPMNTPAGGGIATLPTGMPEQMPPEMMGGPPMPMAAGGPVRHFQQAGPVDADETDSGIVYPPEMIDAARQRLIQNMSREYETVPDLMERTKALAPQYRELLGIAPDDNKAQMLFDISKAALGYAGNVDPQGNNLRGSAAARLAGAFQDVPANIGARVADMNKQNQAIKMAAMQGAQGEVSAAQDRNAALRAAQDKGALEVLKSKPNSRPMTPEERAAYGVGNTDPLLIWAIDGNGKPFVMDGRKQSALINMGNTGLSTLGTNLMNQLKDSYDVANKSLESLQAVERLKPILAEDNSVFAGPLSEQMAYGTRLASAFGFTDGSDQEKLERTAQAMQDAANLELDASGALKGQGSITENERALIKRTAAGDFTKLTQGEIRSLLASIEKRAQWRMDQHTRRLENYTNAYSDSPEASNLLSLYTLGDVPVYDIGGGTQPASSNSAADALAKRLLEGQ